MIAEVQTPKTYTQAIWDAQSYVGTIGGEKKLRRALLAYGIKIGTHDEMVRNDPRYPGGMPSTAMWPDPDDIDTWSKDSLLVWES